MNKSRALDTVMEMPQELEVEDLIEKLLFIQSVDGGLEQSKAGNVFSMDEAKVLLSR